jgi:hypothetical protein
MAADTLDLETAGTRCWPFSLTSRYCSRKSQWKPSNSGWMWKGLSCRASCAHAMPRAGSPRNACDIASRTSASASSGFNASACSRWCCAREKSRRYSSTRPSTRCAMWSDWSSATARRACEGAGLRLRPTIPGEACPFVEIAERQPRLGTCEAGLQLQRPLEQAACFRLVVGHAASRLVPHPGSRDGRRYAPQGEHDQRKACSSTPITKGGHAMGRVE